MGSIPVAEGLYRLYVYPLPREHPPAHCHVFIKGDGWVKVNLLTLEYMTPPPRGHYRAIRHFVIKYRKEALQEWTRLNE